MKIIKQTTGNTGEWSELYALGFLLANGGVYGADSKQNKKDDLFYKVLRVIFEEKKDKERVTYDIGDESIIIYFDNKKVSSVKVSKIKSVLKKFLAALTTEQVGRAYSLGIGEEMIKLLKKEVIKASSKDKKDLDLVLIDIKTKIQR